MEDEIEQGVATVISVDEQKTPTVVFIVVVLKTQHD